MDRRIPALMRAAAEESAMGIWAWFRGLLTVPRPHSVVEHEWGEIREWVNGDCRFVEWSAMMVDSWQELEPIVDPFLAASIETIAAACPTEPVPWMVLRYNPLTGMLSVTSAAEPSSVEGSDRVELTLSSLFLEMQAERTYNESSNGSYDPLYDRVWQIVRKSLREGEASSKLAAARQVHPLRIVAFNSPSGCDDEPVGEMGEQDAAADGGRDTGSS
ncbi:MAG TPA: hypothetical protein VKD71_04145 [Gemmataceae bacterium]|nr:hypothetical protein [Gemmataceae bacterium]